MNKREWMLQFVLANPMYDMEDTIGAAARLYDAICAASPETPQEGAWVEHDGDVSKAPPEGVEVLTTYRNGDLVPGMAGDFTWDHFGFDTDIIRWRYA